MQTEVIVVAVCAGLLVIVGSLVLCIVEMRKAVVEDEDEHPAAGDHHTFRFRLENGVVVDADVFGQRRWLNAYTDGGAHYILSTDEREEINAAISSKLRQAEPFKQLWQTGSHHEH